jgi:K+-sensing histidine kinase KdpD
MTTPRAPLWLLVTALGGPLAASAVLASLRDTVHSANAVLVLVLVVVAVAAVGYRSAGALAAVSSAVWFDFFLTEPYHRFTITDRNDVETAVMLILVGLAVAELALWGRRQQARSSRHEGYLEGVVSAAGMAAAGDTPSAAVVAFVADQIVDVLGVGQCDFVRGPPGGAHPLLNPDGTVTREGREIDVDRSGFPVDDVTELPVRSGGATLGRFVLSCPARVVWPTPEQRRVAAALADQAGVALGSPGTSRESPSRDPAP